MLARVRKAQEEEGFTLIELLVVIIIIGILAAIAIPVFLNQRKKGYDAQTKSDVRNLATLEETYLTDYSVYTNTVGAGGILDFKQSVNDTSVAVTQTDAAGAAIAATTGTNGYCITGTSASGSVFYYNSVKGGFVANCS